MAFKFAFLFALVAIANASVLPATFSVQVPVVKHIEVETPAKYEFAYGVTDLTTGDIKSAEETRDGDRVRGSYSLLDADGLKRTVDYTANSDTGFTAEVKREPVEHVAKVVAAEPKVEIAPVVTRVVAEPTKFIEAPIHSYAPLTAYAAPYGALTKVAYATPNHYTKTVTPFTTGIHYSTIGSIPYTGLSGVHYVSGL